MNYKINSDIDFYKEINSFYCEESDNTCLITGEELTENYVTLDCNHKFNYIPLYNEICRQKNKKLNTLEINRLNFYQVKCPYCRKITNNILPFIINENVELKSGVNYPSKYSLKINTCQKIFKVGKYKGQPCNCSSFIYNGKNLCLKHHKINIKSKEVAAKEGGAKEGGAKEEEAKDQKAKEGEKYNIEYLNKLKKKYTVLQLKKILKDNYLKVSGKKENLIIRLINNNILIS